MKSSKFFGSANFATISNATTAHDDFDWDDVDGKKAYANNPMHELLQTNNNFPIKHPELRDLLSGTIVGKGRKEYFVSIPGVASDAMLPFSETVSELSIGDSVNLFVHGIVLKSDDPMIVSQKKAEAWLSLQVAQEEGATLNVYVKGIASRGTRVQGLQISHNNIDGFIPRSQFSRELVLADAVGSTVPVKVLKANPKGGFKGSFVASEKAIANQAIDEVMNQLIVGDTVSGVVKKIVVDHSGNSNGREIGVLVAIADGEFTAFMHSSEIADTRRPSAIYNEGDVIDVEILSVNKSKREVKVSQRSFLMKGLEEGQSISAKVLRFKSGIGFFVEIGNGLTALLPCSQVSDGQQVDTRSFFEAGDQIQVILTELDQKKNRAIVSYKQATLRSLVEGEKYTGTVSRVIPNTGLYVLVEGVGGLLHFSELCKGEKLGSFQSGDGIEVALIGINKSGDRTLVAWGRRNRF